MRRRDRFAGDVATGIGSPSRPAMPIAWLAIGISSCLAVATVVVDRRVGSAQVILDDMGGGDGVLATAVVETRDLERDSFGIPRFDELGARRPRSIPVALQREIFLLHEHRDRLSNGRWPDPRRDAFPDLPTSEGSPPRMDSGHPDPDRLLPSSWPGKGERR